MTAVRLFRMLPFTSLFFFLAARSNALGGDDFPSAAAPGDETGGGAGGGGSGGVFDANSSGFFSSTRSSPRSQGSQGGFDNSGERFSRKVFVGGLPPDIDEGEIWQAVGFFGSVAGSFYLLSDEITASFRRFGALVVDWPHKAESKSYFPPKGYAFLLFQVCSRSSNTQKHFPLIELNTKFAEKYRKII